MNENETNAAPVVPPTVEAVVERLYPEICAGNWGTDKEWHCAYLHFAYPTDEHATCRHAKAPNDGFGIIESYHRRPSWCPFNPESTGRTPRNAP
jgi:hypothetical protein